MKGRCYGRQAIVGCIGLVLSSASAQLPDSFILTKIGTSAQGINDRGQVVGWTRSADYPYARRAWIWRGGTFDYLPTPDGDESYALSINERGDAVGSIGSAGTDSATLWADGEAKLLKPFPGSGDSVALDLNESREACGWGRTITGTKLAVRWANNGSIYDLDIPRPCLDATSASGINAQGDIAANDIPCDNAYVWRSGTVTLITGDGQANGIYDDGVVVGTFGLYSDTITALERLANDFTSEAFALNGAEMAVGASFSFAFGDRAVENFRGAQLSNMIAQHPRTPLDVLQRRADVKASKYADRLRRSRAKTIARTELQRAANEGQRQAWQQAVDAGQLEVAGAEREYLATLGGHAICDDQDGIRIPWNGDFPVAGDPPIHPNCGCTFALRGATVTVCSGYHDQ